MPAVIHTRVHVSTSFANPYLTCGECHQRATGFHQYEQCGCQSGNWLLPHRHDASADSVCPSWGPVDGCLCQEFLGQVSHRLEEPR